ncbi:hypothetical protein NX059_010199 [Plenodomus lindquistii]|nr:hypothetical protein NX059_010199 [Plenodomus lindquistii]
MKFVNSGRGRGRGRGGGSARGRGGRSGSKKKTTQTATTASQAAVTATQATATRSRAASRLSASATPAPDTRARISATPTAEFSAGPTSIKLTWKGKAAAADVEIQRALSQTPGFEDKSSGRAGQELTVDELTTLFEEDEIDAEGESDSEVNLPTQPVDTGARRSGRAVNNIRHVDFDYGSEGAHAADPEYKQEGEAGSQRVLNSVQSMSQVLTRTTEPSIQVLQLSGSLPPLPKKRGRPSNTRSHDPQPHSSSTSLPTIHELNPDPKIFEILSHLKSAPGIAIELPDLYEDEAQTKALPYTATQLMHTYLTAHKLRLYNICDMITDTWIRAFHTQRHRDQRNNPSTGIWRRNRVLEKRFAAYTAAKKRGRVPDEPKEFERDAPDYGLTVSDPALHPNVLSFDSTLLSDLYTHTPDTCGARRFWSDAMALAGDKTARMFANTSAQGYTWNSELKDDVMKTSLRMLRRKVTLKCEESSEGAWCKRYHEHGAGMCYREAASKWVDRQDEGYEGAQRAGKGKRAVNGEAAAGWDTDDSDDGMGEAIRKGLEEANEEDGRLAKRQRLA